MPSTVPASPSSNDNPVSSEAVSARQASSQQPSPLKHSGPTKGCDPIKGIDPTKGIETKRQTLARLKAEIDRIERSGTSSFVSSGTLGAPGENRLHVGAGDGGRPVDDDVCRAGVSGRNADVSSASTEARPPGAEAAWLSGDEAADVQLGVFGLDQHGTHEIKPAVLALPQVSSGGWSAALAFALRLAARLPLERGADGGPRAKTILFCATSHLIAETGRLYGPGLRTLGLEPEGMLIVETRKPAETLWAMEEGLKSGGLDAVVGCLTGIDLTPARRLSLAAKAHGMPCLMVTDARSAGAGATSSRWRIGMRPGVSCVFDERAPGDVRLDVKLEKLRKGRRHIGVGHRQGMAGVAAACLAPTGAAVSNSPSLSPALTSSPCLSSSGREAG
ncbi:MAG: hypothetical protein K0U74_11565 [Alphaproteobacteria bacterium]|nr:hypothetical protein [Alphaproteobacteria bacterium]